MVKSIRHAKSFSTLPAATALVAVVWGCNVSPTAPATTGGVHGPDGGSDTGPSGSGDGASAEANEGGAPTCDPGTVVLLTDYSSTQIALSGCDGTTESASFLSSASTQASGDAYPLSADVALPNTTPPSGRVVLIDRYGTNVVTWADPATAHVYAQLPVGTGFESNPMDYIEIDAKTAYVSRWGVNGAPGAQAFDSGSDLLVIDTQTPAIIGSIPMPVKDSLPPGPAGMVRVGDTVIVVLQYTSGDFKTVDDSVLVGVSGGAIAWQVDITGLKNCDRPSLSPSGRTMAVGCEGQLDMNGKVVDLSAAAVALYDVTSLPPKPLQRFAISDQLGSPPQSGVAWPCETTVFGKTQTPVGGSANNQAFTLDVSSGKAAVLLTAGTDSSGQGKGLVYGDVRCSPGCCNVCLLADADVGKLRRFGVDGCALQAMSDVGVDPSTGLPPVSLGGF
jgi:hypothetical protein